MRVSDLRWFKSSYSDSGESGDCVEVALSWVKSSYSDSNEPGDCVEVACAPGTVHVRDSKAPDAACLLVGPGVWSGFLEYVQAG
ncbi:DUF397 domain-containing protein [Streptomyces sp. NPDC094437]|uniref:DUF397 domain-containing protein n=1 Tax=Streptomyces sp. NPDC094437 TaxID=3366060 RepID=UPI00382D5D5A